MTWLSRDSNRDQSIWPSKQQRRLCRLRGPHFIRRVSRPQVWGCLFRPHAQPVPVPMNQLRALRPLFQPVGRVAADDERRTRDRGPVMQESTDGQTRPSSTFAKLAHLGIVDILGRQLPRRQSLAKYRRELLGLVRQLQALESLGHGDVICGQFDQDSGQGFGIQPPDERGQIVEGCLAGQGCGLSALAAPQSPRWPGPGGAGRWDISSAGQICCTLRDSRAKMTRRRRVVADPLTNLTHARCTSPISPTSSTSPAR